MERAQTGADGGTVVTVVTPGAALEEGGSSFETDPVRRLISGKTAEQLRGHHI